MNQPIKPSEIVILASGALGFLLTLPFAVWVSWPGSSDGFSAWSTDGDLFPIATYIPLICLALALHIGLAKFANVDFPPQVAGFTWTQIHLVLAIFAGLIALGYLLIGTPSEWSWGLGFWMGLLASIGLITGTVMEFVDERKVGMPGPYTGGPGPYPGGPPPGPYPGPGQPPPPPQQF